MKITSSSQQKCLKSLTVKLKEFSPLRLLETLRADEGLDERPAVGIGITLRGVDGRPGDEGRGECWQTGDEGRNESERKLISHTDQVLKVTTK